VIKSGSDGEKHDPEVNSAERSDAVAGDIVCTSHLVNTTCEGLVVHEVRLPS
jgi:cell shape-determining protein MreC